jgi:Arf-GAP/coiled-coil/ANK repeat/PH domain-containing protein
MLESTQTTQTYFDPYFICSNIREAWIKAKYVERRFVQHLSVLPSLNEQPTSPDHRSSRQLSVRKWSVRKLRRRPRSRDSRGEKKSQSTKRLPDVSETKHESPNSNTEPKDNEENSKDTRTESCGSATQCLKADNAASVEANDTSAVGSEVSDSGSSNAQHELVNADVLLFGENFEKQPLEGSIELSSDQDSTGGEEDEVIGNYGSKPIFLCVIFIAYISVLTASVV